MSDLAKQILSYDAAERVSRLIGTPSPSSEGTDEVFHYLKKLENLLAYVTTQSTNYAPVLCVASTTIQLSSTSAVAINTTSVTRKSFLLEHDGTIQLNLSHFAASTNNSVMTSVYINNTTTPVCGFVRNPPATTEYVAETTSFSVKKGDLINIKSQVNTGVGGIKDVEICYSVVSGKQVIL